MIGSHAHEMSKRIVRLLLFTFAVVGSSLKGQVITSDSLALVALYDSTGGDGWIRNDNWLTLNPVSSWYGVDVTNQRVTRLRLPENNLIGHVPATMGNLDQIDWLFLWGNQITSIPSETASLSKLRRFWIHENQLSSIPSEIGNLESVEELFLDDNQLVTLPPEIGQLATLKYLGVSGNPLAFLPADIGKLDSLIEFSMTDMPAGSMTQLPPAICGLASLQTLLLFNGQLTSLPDSIGNLENLEILWAYNNHIQSLPESFYKLNKMRSLRLSFNQLSGTLDPRIGDLTALVDLRLAQNNFDGTIPHEVGGLMSLEVFQLSGNGFTGAVPLEITGLPNLSQLYLVDNHLNDLPDLTPLAPLWQLFVRDNRFTFEDIEPNVSVASIFEYSPQDSLGLEIDTTVCVGTGLVIDGSTGGNFNQYQWLKNGLQLNGQTQPLLVIDSVVGTDSGDYICKITNTVVTQLVLFTRPWHVHVSGVTDLEGTQAGVAQQLSVHSNYPNPFNSRTSIRFSLPKNMTVDLVIFNLLGEKVAELIHNHFLSAGIHSVPWDATRLPSGVYFFQIVADRQSRTGKLLLIR